MKFKDKKILVAGGTGLIGRSLVKMLIEEGAKGLLLSKKKELKIQSIFKQI